MIVRAWYSAAGAEQGTPWRVQHDDEEPILLAGWQATSVIRIRTLFSQKGFALPDGPRAIIEIELPEPLWKALKASALRAQEGLCP